MDNPLEAIGLVLAMGAARMLVLRLEDELKRPLHVIEQGLVASLFLRTDKERRPIKELAPQGQRLIMLYRADGSLKEAVRAAFALVLEGTHDPERRHELEEAWEDDALLIPEPSIN